MYLSKVARPEFKDKEEGIYKVVQEGTTDEAIRI